MAIKIRTTLTKQQFIEKLNTAIFDGQISTWNVDIDGDYTINREQWRNRAWMSPIKEKDGFVYFGIIGVKGRPLTKEEYGVFHGRFISTLLSHFDTEIDSIEATSMMLCGIDSY